MVKHGYAPLALTILLSAAAFGKEAPGIAVGAEAPAVEGKVWFTKDGKAPELKGKVHLLDFWFAG